MDRGLNGNSQIGPSNLQFFVTVYFLEKICIFGIWKIMWENTDRCSKTVLCFQSFIVLRKKFILRHSLARITRKRQVKKKNFW